MIKRVSTAQARKSLSRLLADVAESGRHVIIEKRGKPMVALVSIEALELLEQKQTTSALLESGQAPLGALALAGAWGELQDRDLNALIADIYAERGGDPDCHVEWQGGPASSGQVYLLDTDILSNLLSHCPSTTLIAKLASVPPEQQFTSSIALGELIGGACRLSQQSAALLSQLETRLIPNLQILPFDASAARRYGEVSASVALTADRAGQQGTPVLGPGGPVGEATLRLAAIALDRDLTIVSATPRSFQRIPGLSVENWLS